MRSGENLSSYAGHMARGASTSVDDILYGQETLSPRVQTLPVEFSLAERAELVRKLSEAEQLAAELDQLALRLAGAPGSAGPIIQAKNAVGDICHDQIYRTLASSDLPDLMVERDFYRESLKRFDGDSATDKRVRASRLEKLERLNQMITEINKIGEPAYRDQQAQRLAQELTTAFQMADLVRHLAGS